MSRYYRIEIEPNNNAGLVSNVAKSVFTNWLGDRADLGAQTVEFVIPVAAFNATAGQATARIWGISKQQISQSSDFNGASIKIFGGMKPGLPLATKVAGQSGLLLSGNIFQAFGNWMGINQTLDFVITGDGGATIADPASLSFTWPQGTKMADMIATVLRQAYPQFTVDINIRSNLVLTQDEHGVYQTIQQFSTYVNNLSRNIIPGRYPGVGITLKDGVLKVFDDMASTSASVTTIDVVELIGQPTWLNPATIQFNTVLRADLSLTSMIKFGQDLSGFALTTPQSGSNVRVKNAFNGTWTISLVRHIGNSRAPDAQSWISTFQAITNADANENFDLAWWNTSA